MFIRNIGLIALALVALAACSSTPKTREPADLKKYKAEVEVDERWSTSIGDGAEGHPSALVPFVAEEGVFVAERGGRIALLGSDKGREVWEVRSKKRIVAGPSVGGDLVLVGTLDGDVIAYARADGKPRWTAKLSTEVLAPPVLAGRVVVARAGDGRVFGLNAETGARQWSFDRSIPPLTLRGLSAPVINGNRVYVGMDNGRIAAAKLDSGELTWEQTITAPTGRSELERLVDIDADVQLHPEGLLVASYGGDVALIDDNDGSERWKRSIKSATPLVADRTHVYVSDVDGTVWALEAQTGAMAWKSTDLAYRGLSSPAVLGDKVVVGDAEGYLHVFTAKDGRYVGREHVMRQAIAAPLRVGGNAIYAQGSKGKVVAVTLR